MTIGKVNGYAPENGSAPSSCKKVNGYAPEKVAFRTRFSQVNGYAPEKFRFLSCFIHFYVLLWTNGHQKEPVLALLTADCSPGKLNGYAPEYVEISALQVSSVPT